MAAELLVGKFLRQADRNDPQSYIRSVDQYGIWLQVLEPGVRTVETSPASYILVLMSWETFTGQVWRISTHLEE